MTGAPRSTGRRESLARPAPSLEPDNSAGAQSVVPDGAGGQGAAVVAADRELADELLATLRVRLRAAREHACLRARQGDEARRRGAAQAAALLSESEACAARAHALARELAALERTWRARTQGRWP